MRKKRKAAASEITRREFLEGVGATAIGLMGLTAIGGALARGGIAVAAGKSKEKSKSGGGKPVVVIGRDPRIWDGTKLNRDKTRDLVFKSLRALTGAGDDKAAWSEFFDENDRVSIKMNCIGGRRMSTTPAVVEAIVSGILMTGVAPKNIAAWDRYEWEVRMAGFKTGRDKRGVLFTATDAEEIGYENDLTTWGEASSLVSRLASAFSTAMVNAPVMKDHDTTGISGALKNWYGGINNPNKLHENACDPYIADVNMMPVFREKTRLIVCDATSGQFHGGPAHKPKYTWQYAGVIVGTDPVAVDTVMLHLLEEKRKSEGLPTFKEEGRLPKFLNTAADAKHKLGENRYEKIRVIEV